MPRAHDIQLTTIFVTYHNNYNLSRNITQAACEATGRALPQFWTKASKEAQVVNSIRDRTQSLVVRVMKWQTNSPEDNYPRFNLQKLPTDEEDGDTETASPKSCQSQPDSSCGFTWSAHVVNSMSDQISCGWG